MKSASHPLKASLAIGIALAAMISLSGCFANPIDSLVEAGVKGVIEDVAGVDVGDVTVGSSVPADFPSSVPLISGTLTFGSGIVLGGQKVWTLTYDVADVQSTFEEGASLLRDAGFTEGFSMLDETSGVSVWESDGYSVGFTVEKKGSSAEAAYSVTENSQ